MRQLSGDSNAEPVIAIVGGGASGTLTAVHLLRHAAWQRVPLQVALIDRHGRHGLGQAYSTTHAAHLLNTMACQTSAFPDEPGHLAQWAGVPPDTFLPRRTYGRYLRDALADAERQAQPHARLTRITAEVSSIQQYRPSHGQPSHGRPGHGQYGRAVRLAWAGGALDADIAVLALGNAPAGLPLAAPSSSRIISDPWSPGALERITDGGAVVVVGTGLTMIDLAIAITSQSPASVIYAVSRHGLLPRQHPGTMPGDQRIWLPAIHTAPSPVRLAELMSQVRAAVAVDPARWHDVVSAMRPHLPDLWYRLPAGDKRLFLAHLARYWEVHRHLMPPATARRIAALRDTGQLTVLPGRVADVRASKDQLCVRVQSQDAGGPWPRQGTSAAAVHDSGGAAGPWPPRRGTSAAAVHDSGGAAGPWPSRRGTSAAVVHDIEGAGGPWPSRRGASAAAVHDSGGPPSRRDGGERRAAACDLNAGWLVNAAGAPADISATADPLLRDLFAAGLARPDSLRLGLDATTYGAVLDASGAASETLFTLGPTLRGLWYETTSMPEIRVQAAALAGRIAASGRVTRPGGRAA